MSKKSASESDIYQNRANVARARSQAILQSWLPANHGVASAKTEDQVQKEDDDVFKVSPELFGVGIDLPSSDHDSLTRRRTVGPNERLLEQLLGKKAASRHMASSKAPRPQPSEAQQLGQALSKEASESDEEEGRASMLASTSSRSRARLAAKQAKSVALSADVEDAETKDRPPGTSQDGTTQPTSVAPTPDQLARDASASDDEDRKPTKKRGASYLDQLLAEKAEKKKKKKQKTAAKPA
ncbi:hypothetical protein MBLNU459_g7222t1 [Dothideomycetes sp. NU459]